MSGYYGTDYDDDGVPVPERVPLGDRLLSVADLAALPPVEPLIDGLLYRQTLAQLSGAPGTYKSFLGVGMACAYAAGVTWEGHAVAGGGQVVYVAAEGATGLRARILAWCDLSNVPPDELADTFRVLPLPIQLGNTVDVRDAVDLAVDRGASLLVLDTRARCTLGLEENSATEQGKAIAAADRILAETGATVLGIHHTGRAGDHGRGSNTWDGAIWSDLRLTGQDLQAKLHVEKHKDVPADQDYHYRLVPHSVPVELMPETTAAQRSTLVAVQSDGLDNESGDTRSGRVVLDIVRTAGGSEGLTRTQIVDLSSEHGLGRSSAYSAVNALVRRNAIRNVGSEKRPRYITSLSLVLDEEDA